MKLGQFRPKFTLGIIHYSYMRVKDYSTMMSEVSAISAH